VFIDAEVAHVCEVFWLVIDQIAYRGQGEVVGQVPPDPQGLRDCGDGHLVDSEALQDPAGHPPGGRGAVLGGAGEGLAVDRGRAFIIVAGEPWYTDSQAHRVPGDGQVSEHADDVVAQPAGLTAAAASRVVFDRLAVDPGEVLVDRGVGDRQTEFDRPADRVGNKVRRLQNGSCGGRRRRREPSSSHRRTRLHVVVPAHPPITALRTPEPEEPVYGVIKMWKAMQKAGWDIGRDQTARLMRLAGVHGVVRGRKPRTTTPIRTPDLRPDLVERD